MMSKSFLIGHIWLLFSNVSLKIIFFSKYILCSSSYGNETSKATCHIGNPFKATSKVRTCSMRVSTFSLLWKETFYQTFKVSLTFKIIWSWRGLASSAALLCVYLFISLGLWASCGKGQREIEERREGLTRSQSLSVNSGWPQVDRKEI
jgi:hypothetical protein